MNTGSINLESMEERVFLNFEGFSAGLDDRITLIPKSGVFQGVDGRSFINSNPAAVIERWMKTGHEIPVDIEHSTEIRRPHGLPAPAVGWISDLKADESGSVSGLVRWTDEGRELIESGKYRYYSPAYLVTRDSGEIVGVKSVGLTNVPNLGVPALNTEEDEGENMENLQVICNSLGIAENSTPLEIATEINSLQERVRKAEARVQEMEDMAFRTELNGAVEKGIREGKIMPSQKDYFLTSINTAKDLDAFNAMCEKSPKIIGSSEEVTGRPEATATSLNSEEKSVLEALGVSVEEFNSAKEAD